MDDAPAARAGGPRPLSQLRPLIDACDARLLSALNERARLVMEVGARKAADGTPVYAPHREQMVLSRVLDANTGPLLAVTVEAIWREIMSGSFALERPLRIGYLGPQGVRWRSGGGHILPGAGACLGPLPFARGGTAAHWCCADVQAQCMATFALPPHPAHHTLYPPPLPTSPSHMRRP